MPDQLRHLHARKPAATASAETDALPYLSPEILDMHSALAEVLPPAMVSPIPPRPRDRWLTPNGYRLPLVLLAVFVAFYLGIGLLYVFQTPAWQVPDEPAHYNYIKSLADTGVFPILEAKDYDQEYLEELKAARFPPNKSIASLAYEDWQPPLYYSLATSVYLLGNGALAPLRIFSLLLGAGVIGLAFLAIHEVYPGRPWLALTGAGFIAFIPQHVAMMAGVNNDSLAELMLALGLALILRENRTCERERMLGMVVGLAFLTKLGAYLLAPAVATMLFLRWRRAGWANRLLLLKELFIIFLPAFVLGFFYWGRNLSVYGWPDWLGAIRHQQVVVGQLTTREALTAWGWSEFLRRAAVFTFQSFWGQFGWMGVLMEGRVYLCLGIFSAMILFAAGVVFRRRPWQNGVELDALIILGVVLVGTLAGYVYYNLSFVQHQGRYLYPALIPIALLVALGLRQWVQWLLDLVGLRRHPLRPWAEGVLPLLPILLLAVLDVYALYRYIIPELAL